MLLFLMNGGMLGLGSMKTMLCISLIWQTSTILKRLLSRETKLLWTKNLQIIKKNSRIFIQKQNINITESWADFFSWAEILTTFMNCIQNQMTLLLWINGIFFQ